MSVTHRALHSFIIFSMGSWCAVEDETAMVLRCDGQDAVSRVAGRTVDGRAIRVEIQSGVLMRLTLGNPPGQADPDPPPRDAPGGRYVGGVGTRGMDPAAFDVGAAARAVGADQVYVCPGLLDLQVNGYGGVDLNADGVVPEDVTRVGQNLWATGCTGFLPTVVTGARERLQRAMVAIRDAVQASEQAERMVLGVHLEGPWLSAEDGPRGAHDVRHIRDPDWGEFVELDRLSGRRIRMVTIAPERRGALEMIRRLVDHGVVVALGHTAASENLIAAAVEAGARMATHLGNGSHPMLPRHRNYVWAQLSNDQLWAGLIADGHHLPPALLKVFIRAKRGRAILVSDAVHLAGMPSGAYETNIGGRVELLENGRLQLRDHPEILAGAACGIDRGIETVIRHTDLDLAQAVRLATRNAAELLRDPARGVLVRGAPADLTLLGYDAGTGALRVLATVLRGRLVYRAPSLRVTSGTAE